MNRDVTRLVGARTGLWVPLLVGERAIGVIQMHDKLGPDARFSDTDLRLAETFGSRAAVAVDLSQRVARDSLRRVVDAQEVERRRLARELHDETGQALTSIVLGLKMLDEMVDGDELHAAVAELRANVVTTLHDVRQLAVELRPKAPSTTSGSSRRSSACSRPSPSRPGSRSISRTVSERGDCPARSKRRCTGSCRRR